MNLNFLFGPNRRQVPGRADRTFVRARVVSMATIDKSLALGCLDDAPEVFPMFESGPDEDRVITVTRAELDDLPTEAKGSMHGITGCGIIQFGNATPAMIYWGDKEQLDNIERVMTYIERNSRPRFDRRRILPVIGSALGVFVVSLALAFGIAGGFNTSNVISLVLGAVLAIWGYILAIAKSSRTQLDPLPHKVI